MQHHVASPVFEHEPPVACVGQLPSYTYIMRLPWVWIAVALLATEAVQAAEIFLLTGVIREKISEEPVAAANIRIAGTSRGTIANADGSYRIRLEANTYSVIVSSLGYHADTLRIRLASDTVCNFSLEPSAIILPEILVTSEDPAIEIIRRAIAQKRIWAIRLHTYEMDAFTRQTLFRDTSIASISESFTKGYWQQGDTLREVILQRRQTANVASEFNVASVGRLLNFNDDEIRFLGYSFVGPTAQNALDYYDYKLLRTRSSYGKEVYDIQMIPRTRTVPLFHGTVSVANISYALMGIDVQPNDAFQIPFIKEKKLRYRQQFGLFDEAFWLPADIRIDGTFTLGIIGFSFPRIAFSQTSVISNYSINTAIPDSIFRKSRVVVDSSATTFDSTFWAENEILPLSTEEQTAYQTIDSSQTLDVQFRPGGIAITLGSNGDGAAFAALEYLDLSFNRVEGFHLGLHADFDKLTDLAKFEAGIAYGTASSVTTYALGATLYPLSGHRFGIGGEVYRNIIAQQGREYYGKTFNSLTALFDKNDYYDYYRSDGWRAFVTFTQDRALDAELSFVSEWQKSTTLNTNYSLISHSRDYRANPQITEGKLRSLRLDLRIGDPPAPLGLVIPNSVELSIEHSTPSLAGSSFDFTRYQAVGTTTIPTIGRSHLFPGFLRLRLAAGTSSGALPPQRRFDVESASSGYAPFGVMRAMDVKEFSGTGYLAFTAEHNFRSLPFLALDIPFLYEKGIEIILHASGARTWNTGPLALTTTDGWYFEEGFGISRLFDILRIDFTWRSSTPHHFRVSLSAAGLF